MNIGKTFVLDRLEQWGVDFISILLKLVLVAAACVFMSLLMLPEISRAGLEDGRFPYVDTMVISAYYSPLPDQQRYATGSYDGDIRLNGSGVNGADGTPVYPGMIAAPKSYPFGFKMKIPGIGTVAVHDRGGAIKGNRLDVWMGYGDDGLQRALNWGKRTVDVEMLGIDEEVKESVYLKGYFEAEKFVRKVAQVTRMFPEDIWYQSEGEEVEKLQKALKEIGYYDGEIDGYYGDSTLQAVYKFQVDYEIVTDWNDLGAGHCGVKTRATIEKLIEGKGDAPVANAVVNPKDVFFSTALKKGDKGDRVVILQKELRSMGYLRIEPTGYYGDVTEHAVYKFQQRKGLVSSKDDPGAGVVGPQTRTAFNGIFGERGKVKEMVAKKKSETDEREVFLADMGPGTISESVSYLQGVLKDFGYFEGPTTDYYGPVTEAAVVAFQVDEKIVKSVESVGAGFLGPKTRSVLNSKLN